MKIFYVCKINLSRHNAETKHLIELAENLERLGEKILIFAPDIGRYYRKTTLKIKYVPTQAFTKVIQVFSYQFLLFFYLVYYVIKIKPDIIYCRLGPFTLIPCLVSKMFRRPYISEVNGFFPEDLTIYFQVSKFELFISGLVEKISYLFANKIIVITPELKNLISERYNVLLDKIEVIHNAANSDIFKSVNSEEAKRRLGLEKDKHYVGFVGNFAPWQGIEYLIKAVPLVVRKYPATQFVIIGTGILENNLKDLAGNLKINDNITFINPNLDEEIPLFMNAFDVCVAPFISTKKRKNPGSPLKLYEYLACEKPVVVSDVGNIGKLVKENNCGLAIEPENPDALAKGIIRLIKNKDLREKMGRNGRQIVEREYNWQNAARKTIKVFKSLVH